MMNLNRRTLLNYSLIAGIGMVSAGLAGCSTATTGREDASGGSGSSGAPADHLVASKTGALTIGLANGWAGNSWRSQMVAEFKYACDNQFKSDVKKYLVTDANNSADKQISQINDMINAGVDLILIDAASASAVAGAVQRAWQQGIQVVSFDNAVDSPHNIVVNTKSEEFGTIGAEFLAKQLKSGDSVVMLDGVSGTPVSAGRAEAAKKALEAAGIKVSANAAGDWDQAKAQAATGNLLSAHPDIKGIYSQGGSMTLGALQVLEQRGLPLMPIPGEGYNGFLKKWKQLKDSKGWASVAPSQSPALVVTALEYGIKALRGTDPGQAPDIKLDIITQDDLDETVREDMPDSLFLPTKLPDAELKKLFG